MRNLAVSRSFEALAAFLCLAILKIKGPAPSRLAVAPIDIAYVADYDRACDLGPSMLVKRRGSEEKFCLLGSFSSILETIRKCDMSRSD